MFFYVNKFGFFWDRHLVLNTNYKNHLKGEKTFTIVRKMSVDSMYNPFESKPKEWFRYSEIC